MQRDLKLSHLLIMGSLLLTLIYVISIMFF